MNSILDFFDKKIIVLTGLMGVGKTTIGKKLAEKLDFYFIDSDQEIEDKEQKSIADIFAIKGQKYFRQIEKRVVQEVICRDENIVLSLGGGAFIDNEIRDLIKKNTISVWLYADIETILRRVANKKNRPLLINTDKRSALLNLIVQRYPIYKQADIHIDTAQGTCGSIAGSIIKKIDHFVSDKRSIKTEFIDVFLKEKSYKIVVGNQIIAQISQNIQAIKNYSKIIVITDHNLANLHLDSLNFQLKKLPAALKNIIVEAGEGAKSFVNLQNILEQILEFGIDRNSLIIAFGGGVIGDLSGFIASILLRGIDFIQVPTTLLAAVDSSIGGKTAINSKFGKNLIGSFYQPKLVFCDLDFLKTLDRRDFVSGYAEVLKYGLIRDKGFFIYLNQNLDKILNLELEILQRIVVRSCQIKAEIVGLDEKENDIRALLNFGHTFGHIFETETGYSNELLHGEAVAIGMILAVKMSIKLQLLSEDKLPLILQHLQKFGLPISPKTIRKFWNIENLTTHLYKDKKVENNNLTFILLEDIGNAVIKKNIKLSDFLSVINFGIDCNFK